MAKVIKLKIVKPTQVGWKQFGSVINELDYQAYKIKNMAMSRYYELWRKELDHNFANPEDKFNAAKRKELFGYSSYESVIENELKPIILDYGLLTSI